MVVLELVAVLALALVVAFVVAEYSNNSNEIPLVLELAFGLLVVAFGLDTASELVLGTDEFVELVVALA